MLSTDSAANLPCQAHAGLNQAIPTLLDKTSAVQTILHRSHTHHAAKPWPTVCSYTTACHVYHLCDTCVRAHIDSCICRHAAETRCTMLKQYGMYSMFRGKQLFTCKLGRTCMVYPSESGSDAVKMGKYEVGKLLANTERMTPMPALTKVHHKKVGLNKSFLVCNTLRAWQSTL